MRIRSFDLADTEQVVALWHAAGLTRPWNDPRKDIERKLRVQPELFLVGEESGCVVATAMAGYDGHRGWLYYFAVDPALQGGGRGTALLAEVERLLTDLGCPKLNVQVREGNDALIERYERWGYSGDHAAGLGKRLIADG